MALNALVDSFCQKKCGTEGVKRVLTVMLIVELLIGVSWC